MTIYAMYINGEECARGDARHVKHMAVTFITDLLGKTTNASVVAEIFNLRASLDTTMTYSGDLHTPTETIRLVIAEEES